MPEAEIAKAVQLLDLMLEFFADDGYWTRGRYDDGSGGHCLVGAVLHLSRKHCLPKAPARVPRSGILVCGGSGRYRQTRRRPQGQPARHDHGMLLGTCDGS
jgi:hypothetical protein